MRGWFEANVGFGMPVCLENVSRTASTSDGMRLEHAWFESSPLLLFRDRRLRRVSSFASEVMEHGLREVKAP